MTAGDFSHTNRLAAATSPYLLQHQHNPVDWWQWGPEALAEAKASNRPILLSVGYAACHWCHVMAHESFEDEATAAVMNALFVNIKVDREERPDIDQIYMNALHLLGEQGGWPLTMFLTPAGEPVWGGTYFPKESKFGRPAFTDILREVSRLFREEPAKIEQNRAALLARLSETARPEGKVTIGLKELDAAAKRLGNAFDTGNGGLRGAPKFPQASLYEFLWRAGDRGGDTRFFDLVDFTLAHICEGGIYDHLGGGFARYSVDEYWLVPHFEKMLYDNAQLLDLLAAAWARSKNPLFRTRAAETVGWLQREMTNVNKAFCSSLDADSEGEEGKFYVWSLAEIRAILGADADYFALQYDVSDEGNFEGHNILNRLKHLPRNIGVEGGPAPDEDRLAMLRGKLLKERENRVRPGLDDKVLADWNGLTIAALVHAGTVFEEPEWVGIAQQAYDFIAKEMTRGDRLGHSWRDARLLLPGLASDFASMIRAALALNEATGDAAYLHQALVWQAALDRHYANPANGGYFLTANDAEGLVVRPAATNDDATPNPNSVAAENLVRLAALTGDDQWRARADTLLEGILATAQQNLFGHVALLNALDFRLRAAEIVCTGPEAEAFAREALKLPHLSRIVLRASSAEALPPSHPAQEKVKAVSGSAAFVCVGERCSLPVTEPGKIAAAVAAMA
ncbi:thymidylate kinase [Pseudolabrys sp. Root1462]|uniref:thioredoxin domain-containing protein n=1 Tax=Pseudolabrys sp. Root1462 TaxID=1736466 RepID=UPI000703BD55|nr:thioredoxin domain-containing protein [Pseudolabrys sp. Root1462]KQY97802.1 thymidylate kinase [Pseudolabrys sp. Root1462]